MSDLLRKDNLAPVVWRAWLLALARTGDRSALRWLNRAVESGTPIDAAVLSEIVWSTDSAGLASASDVIRYFVMLGRHHRTFITPQPAQLVPDSRVLTPSYRKFTRILLRAAQSDDLRLVDLAALLDVAAALSRGAVGDATTAKRMLKSGAIVTQGVQVLAAVIRSSADMTEGLPNDVERVESNEPVGGPPSAVPFVALLEMFVAADRLVEARSALTDIIENELVSLSGDMWSPLIHAQNHLYRADGRTRPTHELVALACRHEVTLDVQTVLLAVECSSWNDAETIERLVDDSGMTEDWTADEHRSMDLALARRSAVVGNVGATIRLLLGTDGDSDEDADDPNGRTVDDGKEALRRTLVRWTKGGRPNTDVNKFLRSADQEQLELLLTVTAAQRQPNWGTFALAWRIIEPDDDQPYRRRRARITPRSHLARCLIDSRRNDRKHVDEAISRLVEKGLEGASWPGRTEMLRSVLQAIWSNSAGQATRRLDETLTAQPDAGKAVLMTMLEMAVISGQAEAARSVVTGITNTDQSFRAQAAGAYLRTIAHAAASGRDLPEDVRTDALELMRDILNGPSVADHEFILASLSVADQLSRSDRSRAVEMVNALLSWFRSASSRSDAELPRRRITDDLVRVLAKTDQLDTALDLAAEMAHAGESASRGTIRALDAARVRAGRVDELTGAQDPMESLRVVGIVVKDIRHEVSGMIEGITNGLRRIENSAARGKDVRTPLQDTFESVGVISRRMDQYESLVTTLQAGEENLAGSTSTIKVVEAFLDESAQREELEGIPLQLRLGAGTTRRQTWVKAPEYFVDLVVKNLVRNSANALRNSDTEDPSIVVEIDRDPEPDERFPSGVVTISVIDNGPGFPEENRRLLREQAWVPRGEAGSEGGLGTGLALVNTVAWMVGGEFEIPQRITGTTAIVRLPAVSPETSSAHRDADDREDPQ